MIIWPFKALLWPQKDPFQVVASQILCTETIWNPFLFRRVQILKHAYKSHFIDAPADADAHRVE